MTQSGPGNKQSADVVEHLKGGEEVEGGGMTFMTGDRAKGGPLCPMPNLPESPQVLVPVAAGLKMWQNQEGP